MKQLLYRPNKHYLSVLQEPKKCKLFTLIKVIYSPTDALVSCLKKNNIKIYIKTAPTCFTVKVTPSSESALV